MSSEEQVSVVFCPGDNNTRSERPTAGREPERTSAVDSEGCVTTVYFQSIWNDPNWIYFQYI